MPRSKTTERGCLRAASFVWVLAAVLCLSLPLSAAESSESAPPPSASAPAAGPKPAEAVSAQVSPPVQDDGSTTLDFANGLYARKMYAPAIEEYSKYLASYADAPAAADARFRMADCSYFLKDYKAAVAAFGVFTDKHSSDSRFAAARFRLGTSHFYLKEWAAARRSLEVVARLSTDPNLRSGALYYTGKAFKEEGDTASATAAFQQLAREYPQTDYASYASVLLGDQFAAGKQYREALSAYMGAAIKENPADVSLEARFRVAETRFALEDYAGAKADYETLLAKVSAAEGAAAARARGLKEKALTGLFYCDYHAGDLAAATARLEAHRGTVASMAEEPAVLFLISALYQRGQDLASALQTIDKVLSHPKLDDALREKALYKKAEYLSAASRKEEALTEIRKISDLAHPIDLARAVFEESRFSEDLGRTSEALAGYARVVAEYPQSEYAHQALYHSGVMRLSLQDTDGAKADLSAYLEKYPEAEYADEVRLQLVQIDLDAKDFEAAAAGAQDFLARSPKSAITDIACYKLGVAFTALNRHSEAASMFRRIIEEFPSSPIYVEALYGAAAALEGGGGVAGATANYEKIVAEHPSHPMAEQAISRLGYLYIQAGDYPKVTAFYKDILFNKPQVQLQPEGVFWLIQHLLGTGEKDTVFSILEVLPKRFPGKDLRHEIRFFTAEAHMDAKDYPKALEFYWLALQAQPEGTYAAHAYLGMGLASAVLGKSAEAEKYFGQALQFDGEVKVGTRARFEMASLRLSAGDLAAAAKGFMLVAILYDDPKYTPLSLYKAGECFLSSGKTDLARQAFGELLQRYPESKPALQYKEKPLIPEPVEKAAP